MQHRWQDQGRFGYHVRTGEHDVIADDWEKYPAFTDRHFGYGQGK
jgi:hypothetical protein